MKNTGEDQEGSNSKEEPDYYVSAPGQAPQVEPKLPDAPWSQKTKSKKSSPDILQDEITPRQGKAEVHDTPESKRIYGPRLDPKLPKPPQKVERLAKDSSRSARVLLRFLGFVGLAYGVAFISLGLLNMAWEAKYSEKTFGTIVTLNAKEINQTNCKLGTGGAGCEKLEYVTCSPVVEFEVEGKIYSPSSNTFISPCGYSENSKIPVFYNPENPSDAMLLKHDNMFSTMMIFNGIAGWFFSMMLFLGAHLFWRSARKARKAGWYLDPHNDTQQRYWDGENWTDNCSPFNNSTERIKQEENLPTASAGWYSDPDDNTQYRYWNGINWTNNYSPISNTVEKKKHKEHSTMVPAGWYRDPNNLDVPSQQRYWDGENWTDDYSVISDIDKS